MATAAFAQQLDRCAARCAGEKRKHDHEGERPLRRFVSSHLAGKRQLAPARLRKPPATLREFR
jgi:hypothetical protein